jgi:hypothetical protein
MRTEGMVVKAEKFLGTYMQKEILNSLWILLNLVNSTEIHREIRKMQNQFCWFPCEKLYNFCKT